MGRGAAVLLSRLKSRVSAQSIFMNDCKFLQIDEHSEYSLSDMLTSPKEDITMNLPGVMKALFEKYERETADKQEKEKQNKLTALCNYSKGEKHDYINLYQKRNRWL